ncbi:hypothetical protein Tco_0151491 [Tanacetum coccineum]
MAESSSQNSSSPKITPKEEHITLDKPESPNPFLPASQVDYAKLIWEDLIHKLNKKTREKIVPYPRFISLLLEHMMPKYDNEELTINPTQAICNLDVHVDSKAPKPSLQNEEVPQGKKLGAKSRLRIKQSSKHTSESKTEASKSKTGQSEKDTQSSSAKDKSPSHPLPPKPMVGEMHKEAHQAAGGPTSLGATNEGGAHPQLSSSMIWMKEPKRIQFDHIFVGSNPSVLVDKTKSAGDGLKTAHTESGSNEESRAADLSKKIKLEDLLEFCKDTRSAFFTSDSPQDEPIIVTNESEEEKADKEDTHDTSHDVPEDTSSHKDELEQPKANVEAKIASLKARPYYPDINQLTDLLVTSLKPELSKLLASHNFASCLPTDLQELPSKFTKLSGEIKELKQHVKDMESELPGDLKEIPTKLETFTFTISSITSQVIELKNIQWDLPAEFTTLVENASTATKDVPSAGQATASPAEGEKNTKDADTNLKDELVDLLGKNVVTQEDGSDEVISNLKVGDLHSAEWREVIQACPDKSEEGWKTIYDLVKTRLDQLTQTEQELKIDLNKPLKE